ncbi:23S rRNA (pseudouridine(1915)-N(3))-methyltransferase RlmH [bacterium]|nr:23S rRNA (pseudouridine(1915)-N(3))-methyltransferase RlmH [bacterium]
MRKIRVICVGKNQEKYIQEGIKSYEKKLRRYCNFKWDFVKEADYGKGSEVIWLQDEFKRLSKLLDPNAFTIACYDKGESLSSVQFAEKFKAIANNGYSRIDFIIGGPFGLPEEILKTSNMVLSISAMTFTHQMARLILSEQIYRAFTIINNESYHHA